MGFKSNIETGFKARQQLIFDIIIKIFICGIFLPFKFSNVAFFLLAFFWIINSDYKHSFTQLKEKKLLFFFMGFYLLHVVGLLFTDNLFSAYKELERKLPLLLLPLIIGSIKNEIWQSKRKEFLDFYLKVTAITCCILILYAIFRFLRVQNPEVFYFKEFTNLIQVNPIYLAMYVLFGFGIYFIEVNVSNNRIAWIKKGAVFLLTLVMLMFISSKTALAVFMLLNVYIIFNHLKNFTPAFRTVFTLTAILLVVAILNYFPVTKERIHNLFESEWSEVWQEDYTKNATTFTGFTVRVSFWMVALKQLAADNLLIHGVGTGDGLDYLNQAYEKSGLIAAGYTDFNLHNAFMEIILEFGITGFVIYLLIWVSIAIFAIKYKDSALILLLIIILFFSMTESIFYVNKGLVFFSFWISFLVNYLYITKLPLVRDANPPG